MRLIIFLAVLFLGTAPVSAQPTELYEPVLQHMQTQHPGKPLVLNNTVVKVDCLTGGCEQPWAGTLPRAWLEKVQARGLIADFCVSHGYCGQTAGGPIPGAIDVMLTSATQIGRGFVDG